MEFDYRTGPRKTIVRETSSLPNPIEKNHSTLFSVVIEYVGIVLHYCWGRRAHSLE
jgi:hypothetical protein